ncbi:MAG TPA: nuclear transport factor 2 family protein [Solirubrobacterales bacterium]|nr:nuclear transport factor 2 family protein [Solirubrobacterales bacterium]
MGRGPRSLQDRSPRECLDDHLRLRGEGRLDEDLERNYREDVVMLTPEKVYHGHDGVREAAGVLYEALQHTDYEITALVTDDRVALLEWGASGDEMEIADGVDSFLIEGGLICVQTIRYTVTFRTLSQAQNVR